MNEDVVEPTGETTAPAAINPSVFAKRKNRGNIRKRTLDEGEPNEDDSAVIQKAKQLRGAPLTFTTKREDKDGVLLQFESNKALPVAKDEAATRALETETAFDRDSRARREQVLKQTTGEKQDDKKYRGLNNYTDFRAGFRREQTISSEKGSGAHGPLRGSSNVRMSVRMDYQPDLCKDYKETGFCSYGDSCKFLHDRGDYKSGWELEREWESEQKAKLEKRMAAMLKGWDPDDGDDEPPGEEGEEGGGEEELPFACFVCRKPWEECGSDPVVTKCKHYFCQTCAIKQNNKTGKCAACGSGTQGIFNIASDILKRMKKAKT